LENPIVKGSEEIKAEARAQAEGAFEAMLLEKPHLRNSGAAQYPELFKIVREWWLQGYLARMTDDVNGRGI